MADKPQNSNDEIAQLRAQLDELSDPVQPAAAAVADKASGAADKASGYAQQAYATVNQQTEWFADRTRQSPLIVLVSACIAGYLLGRIVR